MEILKVENLVKTYGKGDNQVTAVDNISFSIQKGEFVAIVGASGSGKSTLLHLLGGVDRPTSGKVYIDGKVISDYTNIKFYEDFGPYQIPEDSYFMMGDNRNSSWDSRYWMNKFVARGDLIGKAEFEYYPEMKLLK